MKLALTLAAGLMAASSLAFAADNNGGDKGGKDGMKDQSTTGSIQRQNDDTGDDAMKCREGVSGGAPCQEPGTTMEQ